MSPKGEALPRKLRRAIAASLPHLPRQLSQAKGSLALIPLVGSSHIEGGLNMGLVLQNLRKTKTLTYQLVLPILKRFFPTTGAHYNKFP
jgi:hypothetical protein